MTDTLRHRSMNLPLTTEEASRPSAATKPKPVLFAPVVVFHLLDVLSTVIALSQNARESNPLAQVFIEQFGVVPGLLGLKTLTLLLIYILWRHAPIKSRTRSFVLVLGIAFGLVPFLLNLEFILS